MAGSSLTIKRRLVVLLIGFGACIIALTIRLFWIQLVKGDWYQKKAFEQQLHSRTVTPPRGSILDRNGKPLAVSASIDSVVVNPAEISDDEERQKIASKLSEILQMDYEAVYKKVAAKSRIEIVKKQIDRETGDKIRQWINDENIRGVMIDESTKRYYPNANLASHVLGFTGTDNQGLDGVEKTMDKYLKGTAGKIIIPSDARGKNIPFGSEKYLPPEEGLNVVLTIDETIQHFAEAALENAMYENKVAGKGSVIVMDPKTGEILAMASKPDYDPNTPFAAPPGADASTWKGTTQEEIELLSRTVWRNSAIADTYEPGSVFKPITVSAGLEERVTSPSDTFYDKGYVQVGGFTIHCWKTQGHGLETLAEGLYNSCNPVMMEIASRLGKDNFYKYVRAFGYNERTGIQLPGEATGLFHNYKDIGPVELATASFGQRFQVTPIQMATALSAIANGGKLMKPTIIKELVDSEGNIVKKYEPEVVRQVISEETSAILREFMEGVVSKGTGRNAYLKGYRVAGKTGTSEKGLTDDFIGSFVGFAPADDPVVLALMVLDSPKGPFHQGSQTAAPATAALLDNILRYMKVEPRYTEDDQIVYETEVPDVRGMTLDEAKDMLYVQFRLSYKVEGNGNNSDTIVIDQTPKPYVKLPQGSTVILYTSTDVETMVRVPDLTNKTLPEARATLHELGLNMIDTGVGVAVKQSEPPGTLVPKGTIINVTFMYLDDAD